MYSILLRVFFAMYSFLRSYSCQAFKSLKFLISIRLKKNFFSFK